LIYVFIAARVTGFILGDACTAFFLAKVDSSPLKLIARSEREKGKIYMDWAQADGERKLAEAKAEADLTMIEIEVQQKQRDAEFLAALKARAFAQALGETPSALAKSARSRVYRGNT
jgi:aspartyl-tRNA synthetase